LKAQHLTGLNLLSAMTSIEEQSNGKGKDKDKDKGKDVEKEDHQHQQEQEQQHQSSSGNQKFQKGNKKKKIEKEVQRF